MSRVSVIVVSHGRPSWLRRCVTGIGQLCHSDFELVVVADQAGVQAITEMGLADHVKLAAYNKANISIARNLGLARAAGGIVAYIDDDAVPEPSWLCRLTEPFADPGVAATGGYVLGRDGITLQWGADGGARAVDRCGDTVALDAPGDDPFEPDPPPGFAVKTEGTNCAFRRNLLARLGGFDPAFRYYLDETDVNLRIADAGGRTVLVPRALVHHGFAAAYHRTTDRTPRDLTEIGASKAVFLRKHADPAGHRPALVAFRQAQRRRLLRHMVAGGLEPRDVGRRLVGFSDGVRVGKKREIAPLQRIPVATDPFLPFTRSDRLHSVHFAGRPWQKKHLRAKAKEAAARGVSVTVFVFGPSARPHQMRFHPGGWWEQTGGVFGPSARTERQFHPQKFRARVAREWARIADLRQCR